MKAFSVWWTQNPAWTGSLMTQFAKTYLKIKMLISKMLTREEWGGENNVPHPSLAIDLCVKAAGDISWHAACQSIEDNCCWVDGTVTMYIEHSQQRHDNNYCERKGSLLYQIRQTHYCRYLLLVWNLKKNSKVKRAFKSKRTLPVARVRNWAPTPSTAQSKLL